MAQTYRETHSIIRDDRNNDRYDDGNVVYDGAVVAARVVSIIGGVIMGLLALRFILSLLGASRASVFADMIYGLSQPFAAPFFGLFNYDATYGQARFEFETLFAIVVYALLTWLVVRLLTVNRTNPEV